MSDFHFLYPEYFWLLVPLLLILLWLAKRGKTTSLLHKIVDPKLAPYVLTGQSQSTFWRLVALAALAYTIAIFAIAGPTWDKVKQEGYKKAQAVVVAMDLSRSMFAKDVQPSRLSRLRFELIDLLRQRKEGQTGLVVYAGDAFTVAPLTDDTETIESQAKHLSPNVMPVLGSRAANAIQRSADLLKQSGAKTGHILLLTDEIADTSAAAESAKRAAAKGYSVSVLSIGTRDGAPIPLPQGGFLKDANDDIIIAKTNPDAAKKVANAGKGIVVDAVAGDQDLARLVALFSSDNSRIIKEDGKEVEAWINQGIWLVLLLLPFMALAFRKGYVASVLLVICLVPQTEPVMAFSWDDLWLTPDQQGKKALDSDKPEDAIDKFEDPNWKAAAEYKAGNYEKALEGFSKDDSVDGVYNQANTLLKMGDKKKARELYEEVLKRDKNHEDARHNLGLTACTEEEKQTDPECKDKQNAQNNQSNNQQQQPQQQNNQQNDQNQSGSGDQPQDEQNAGDQEQQSDDQNSDSKSEADKAAEEAEQKELDDLKNQADKNKAGEEDKEAKEQSSQATDQQREQEQATEQWLRRIPDDPSLLWRNKFKYQYRDRSGQEPSGQSW